MIDKLKITWDEVAFIGDDINDVQLLKKVGMSACPAQSPAYVKSVVKDILDTKGGDGAFRSFVELILTREGSLEKALEIYFDNLKFEQ